MANELDKTIEELEAEVLSELEEANGQDAPMKSAAPAEKVKMEKDYEDTGSAVVDPEQKDAPAKKVAAKAKEVSGDVAQKSEGPPDKMDTGNDGMKKVAKPLAAGDQFDSEGEDLSEMDKMEMMKKEMAKMTKAEMYEKMQEMMKGAKKENLMAMFKGMKQANEMEHEEET